MSNITAVKKEQATVAGVMSFTTISNGHLPDYIRPTDLRGNLC